MYMYVDTCTCIYMYDKRYSKTIDSHTVLASYPGCTLIPRLSLIPLELMHTYTWLVERAKDTTTVKACPTVGLCGHLTTQSLHCWSTCSHVQHGLLQCPHDVGEAEMERHHTHSLTTHGLKHGTETRTGVTPVLKYAQDHTHLVGGSYPRWAGPVPRCQ